MYEFCYRPDALPVAQPTVSKQVTNKESNCCQMFYVDDGDSSVKSDRTEGAEMSCFGTIRCVCGALKKSIFY